MDEDRVIQLPGTERGIVPLHLSDGIDPDVVLEAALGQLLEVVIVGRHEDGYLYLAGSEASLAENVFLLQKAINEFVRLSELDVVHV